jgi:hypothetical protein
MANGPVGKPPKPLENETDPTNTLGFGPPLPVMEDRGTAHYIWADTKHASFIPFKFALERYEISVPIGWTLKPNPIEGVILQSIFLRQMSAPETLGHAIADSEGFRVRHLQLFP